MQTFFRKAVLAFGFLAGTAQAQGIFPPVVSNVNLPEYLGRWYEVASTKPAFEQNCVCTTADYSLKDEKTVQVVNSCRLFTADGELSVIEGTAKTTRNPAKLSVSFGGFSLPFSNYWIVDLADDYRYAVVSSPFRDPVFVLSRTPEISAADLSGIYERLAEDGYRVERISPTLQTNCQY